MRLPDTNVLLYAVNSRSPQHDVARRWIESAMVDPQGVGMAWLVLVGFLRLSTRTGILPQPLPVADALSVLDDWLSQPRVSVVAPGERHAGILGRLLLSAGTAGNLTNDAHLAALAIEHNAEVGSFDRDFKRFAGLRFQLLA